MIFNSISYIRINEDKIIRYFICHTFQQTRNDFSKILEEIISSTPLVL